MPGNGNWKGPAMWLTIIVMLGGLAKAYTVVIDRISHLEARVEFLIREEELKTK